MTRRLERTGGLYLILIAIGAVGVVLWIFVIEPVMKTWGWVG